MGAYIGLKERGLITLVSDIDTAFEKLNSGDNPGE